MVAEIMAFGEPLFEFSKVDVKEHNQQGDFRSGFGGDCSNFAISAARQGAKTGMFCHLGDDFFGQQFMSLWEQESVDTSLVKMNHKAFTGGYFINYDEQGHHFSFIRKGSATSQITPYDIPHALSEATLLHFSGITHAISDSCSDSVFFLMKQAQTSQQLISFDVNLRLKLWSLERARGIIDASVPLADILFISEEEALVLHNLTDNQSIIDHYLSLGCPLVVLKLGAQGAIAATPTAQYRVQGHRVNCVDATGAGDTFAGAFCASYLDNHFDVEASLHYANIAASLSVQRYGAIDGIPTKEHVLTVMREKSKH